MSNIITLRNVYKVKEIHFQPGKQENGLNFPFVKPVRYNGTESEMILSDAERNSPESRYFLPEDMDIVITDGTTFDLDDPYQANIWASIRGSELIVPTRDAKDAQGNLIIDVMLRDMVLQKFMWMFLERRVSVKLLKLSFKYRLVHTFSMIQRVVDSLNVSSLAEI